jgi:hypothetical protein
MLNQFSKVSIQLGSFPFTSTPLTNTYVKTGTNTEGKNWLYFGEMEEGSTTISKGRGIKIFDNKEVEVGHFEKNFMNGQ